MNQESSIRRPDLMPKGIKNQGGKKNPSSSIIHDPCFMILSRGFTLIELLIVIVVVSILTSISTASFFEYKNTQTLQAATDDLTTTLNTARSNALSQLKPPVCGANKLEGYKVILFNNKNYNLFVSCAGDNPMMNQETLPDNIVFTSPTPSSFFFTVLTGRVLGAGTITLSGFGKTRNITVSSTGVIK